MKAILLKKLGGPNVLKVTEVTKPAVTKPTDVLVRLHYSGINYAEILSRKGLYQWVPQKKNYILGMEGAGVVEEIGKEVKDIKIGDRVLVLRGYGCHAEFIKLHEKFIFPIPKNYSLEDGAAFTGSFMTAYIAITRMARMRKKESILVQAGAGALGTSTIKLAKAMEMTVIATASNCEKIQLIEELGVDLAINYTKDNFKEKVMNFTNNTGVDVVLESVGGKVFRDSLKCLAPMGKLVMVGISSVRFNKFNPLTWYPTLRLIPRVNLLKMLGKSQGVMGFHAGRLLDNNYQEMMEMFLELVELVEKKNIKPVIGKIFPLSEIAEAHKFIESRKSHGKVLLKIVE